MIDLLLAILIINLLRIHFRRLKQTSLLSSLRYLSNKTTNGHLKEKMLLTQKREERNNERQILPPAKNCTELKEKRLLMQKRKERNNVKQMLFYANNSNETRNNDWKN